MTMQDIVTLLSIFAIVSDVIVVAVVVYVRGVIAPLIERVKVLEDGRRKIDHDQERQWSNLGDLTKRVSYLEGRMNGRQ